MATPSSRRRPRSAIDALRGKDPASLTAAEVETLVQECARRIALFEGFEASEEWALQRAVLERRRETLQHELTGMIKRLSRPVAGQPPVTLEQIAAQQARIDENARLLTLPKVTLGLWRGEREGLEQLRRRQA